MLQQHVEDPAADSMDEPLETDHSQNGKIEFHEDSDEVGTLLFLRTKAGIESAKPALPVDLQRNQLLPVYDDERLFVYSYQVSVKGKKKHSWTEKTKKQKNLCS